MLFDRAKAEPVWQCIFKHDQHAQTIINDSNSIILPRFRKKQQVRELLAQRLRSAGLSCLVARDFIQVVVLHNDGFHNFVVVSFR